MRSKSMLNLFILALVGIQTKIKNNRKNEPGPFASEIYLSTPLSASKFNLLNIRAWLEPCSFGTGRLLLAQKRL